MARGTKRWILWVGRLFVLVIYAVLLAYVVIVGMAFGGADTLASRLSRFEASMDFRVDAWRNAALVIQQHPWLGIGPHTFVAVAANLPPVHSVRAA